MCEPWPAAIPEPRARVKHCSAATRAANKSLNLACFGKALGHSRPASDPLWDDDARLASLWERVIGGDSLISISDLAGPEVIRLTPRFEPKVNHPSMKS